MSKKCKHTEKERELFIKLWNHYKGDIEAMKAIFGISRQSINIKVSRLRKKGVPMYRHRKSKD